MAQQPRDYTPNEKLTARQVISGVLARLEQRREELSAVLPPDMPFVVFQAIANQAMRLNPDILDCEPLSLINSFVKAGYDGLKVDGVEACITPDYITPKGGGKKIKTARYMAMYRGMAQQVLRGGMVTRVSAAVIYENDLYDIQDGTERFILHKPNVLSDRGKPILVYNTAEFPNGAVDFVYLTAAQVLEIQKDSKSGWKDGAPAGVWRDHWEEQWKKTAIRRHRKTLPVPSGYIIRDMDAADDFPQYARQDRIGIPARPQRGQLSHDPNAGGTPLDIGAGFQDERELVEDGGGAQQEQRQDQKRAADPEQDHSKASTAEEIVDMPGDPAEWDMWWTGVKAALAKAGTIDAANNIVACEQKRIDASPDRDEIMSWISDRVADLASGGGASAADGAGNDDNASAE